MKKLIFLFILCLFGCGHTFFQNSNDPHIVVGISEMSNKECVYSTNYDMFSFVDKCNKYVIGDTVIISKK